MDEYNKDIQRLAKIKKQRPAFARMISWDMGQAADPEYHKKVKKKQARSQTRSSENQASGEKLTTEAADNEDEDVCQSAGSSDYETANEKLVDDLELSGAFSSINTEASFDTADIASDDDLDTDGEEMVNDDEAVVNLPTVSTYGELQPGRKRRPSKRQKRKKRELYKVTYAEEFLSLGKLFDMTDDIESVFTETNDVIDSVEVSCPVPTLAELCLQATRQKRQRNKSGPKSDPQPNVIRPAMLPQGMKRIVSSWRFNQQMLGRQLKFLQNFVLSSLRRKGGLDKNQIYYQNRNDEEYVAHYPVRSVWCATPITLKDDEGFVYPSARSTAYLYMPTMRPLPEHLQEIMGYENKLYLKQFTVASTHNLSALATTIDLMLPGTLCDRGRSHLSSTDGEVIASASKTMIYRVRNALRARYPELVDELFDKVIPYAMWARGNIGQATQMFQFLVQKETRDVYKAMYLSEIAVMHDMFGEGQMAAKLYLVIVERSIMLTCCTEQLSLDNVKKYVYKAMYLSEIAVMHAMFGEGQMAAKFYKLAAEVAVTKEMKDEAIRDNTEQTQVLLASIHDSGFMTSENAQAAFQSWSSAINLPSPKQATVLAASDSLLCYHLAHLTDDCWSEAESRLRAWSSSSSTKYLTYYLSLILALRGKASDSTDIFMEFRAHNAYQVPGDPIFHYLEKADSRNPWSPLITILKNQRVAVKPLKVVWRTQFRPARLTKDKQMETDLCSRDLNLRIGESGHLTGDMQMLMPPIRDVTLDLHTGSLTLNNTPGHTGVWKAAKIRLTEKEQSVEFMLPTQIQLFYDEEDGTTVRLMNPSLAECHANHYSEDSFLPTCPMVLIWKGPDGQTARINLVNAVKDFQMADLRRLKYEQLPLPYYRTVRLYKVIKSIIETAYNKNLSLHVQDLFNTARLMEVREKSAATKKKNQSSSGPKKQSSYSKKKEDDPLPKIPKDFSEILRRFTIDLDTPPDPLQFGKGLVVPLFDRYSSTHYHLFLDTTSREGFLNYKLVPYIYKEMDQSQLQRRQFGKNSISDKFFMFYSSFEWLHIHNEKGELMSSLNLETLKRTEHPDNNLHLCIIGDCVFGVNRSGLRIWKHFIGLEIVNDDFELMTSLILAPYWELEDSRKTIVSVLPLGAEVGGKGRFLFVHMSVGLGLMDPDKMDMIPIQMPEGCTLTLSEDGNVILVDYEKCELLAEKSFVEDGTAVYRFAIGTQNKLLLFNMVHEVGSDVMQANLLHYFFLPGVPKEVCIVGKEVGLLVSLTQQEDHHDAYREHLFHFRNDGLLHAVLPCLGRGSHSFCPVYIGGGERGGEGGDRELEPGWYVYMRDGHDAIMCVKLF